MKFQDWIREERKVKKYISRQAVWEAALRLGAGEQQETEMEETAFSFNLQERGMSIKTVEIYKNEINNIGNNLMSFDNHAVNVKGKRLKVLADKLHKEIAALRADMEFGRRVITKNIPQPGEKNEDR
jgi:hypothetical protein